MRKPEDFIGKRVINHATNGYRLGIIEIYRVMESERYDEIVCVDKGLWGHRKYFFIEGIDKEFEEIIKTP